MISNLVYSLETQKALGIISESEYERLLKVTEHLLRIEEENNYASGN